MTDAKTTQHLKSIVIDDDSLAAASRDQEQERQVAIFDLLDSNYFEPAESEGGPYDLRLSLIENRLAFDIVGPTYERRHLLSLSPFRGVIKDYFMICDSYYSAIRSSTPQQIKTDLDTARRLFTLICALHWRG